MPDRTHYEVLGIAQTATLEEIKKQYRALARRYHPDVNPGNESAARTFTAVAVAYRALADTESRRSYDAELDLRARQAAQRAAAPNRTAASPQTAGASTPGAPAGGYPAAREAERLVDRARAAFVRGQMAEARNLSEQALRYNRRSGGAHEVLGDICRQQRRIDDAMRHYTLSLQFDPRNASVQQRMERLARESAPPAPAGFATARPRPGSGSVIYQPEKRPLARVFFGFVGYMGAAILALFAALTLDHVHLPPPDALHLPFAPSWTPALIGYLAGIGGLLGVTMAMTGAVQRVEEDFLLGGAAGGRARTVPLGILVLVLGAINFYVAAVVHLVIALAQETLGPSLVRLYGAVVIVVLALALPYVPGQAETLLWGGNLVFLAHFVGRLLGDVFRAD